MKLLKVLKKDLKSPFQCFQFELGKKHHCKNFNTNKDYSCAEGFYATDIQGLLYSLNNQKNNKVFQADVTGRKVEIDIFKRRFENIEIIKEIPLLKIKQLAQKEEQKLGYKLSEALFPFNPLTKLTKPTKTDIENLIKWDSVRASVRASVWDSVRDSVWASIGDSVGNSVWDSVRASVWASVGASVRDSVRASVRDSVRASVRASVGDSARASVGAYISSLFFNIKKWKYIDHKEGDNPFQPGIDLWMHGLIPSFDGKTWRLHSGKNAKIVYERNK